MPEQGQPLVYECEGWEMDLPRQELRARGVPVSLGSRAFEIFAVLVQSAGELVSKDEIMARVWPGAIVEENKLQVHISAIRKALGTDRETLRTSFGRGYRLVGNWTPRKEPTDFVPRMQVQPFLTNLPAAASELIGRNAAVQHLQDLLSSSRAITLTGPGGIGKTALALEVVRNLVPAFQGDCLLVDLAPLSDRDLVPSVVAGVLGLKLGDKISSESVARAIGGKKLLLVLDNCEHLIEACAQLAETILHLCPAAFIVATSREILRIDGEQVFRVPPLDVPSHDQAESDIVLRHSAVQLFITRVKALDPEFSAQGESLRAITAICRRLDGIPLAIEFAAARAAMLGPELVLSRLDKRFELLIGGFRTALPRHQTLRATLEWSYDLLSESERCLLRRLAIFAAGFTIEAATAVMDDKGYTASLVIEQLANLVAKSLVTLDGSRPTGRWRMLETIRAYALEKLAESGEAEQIARRGAQFFRDLVRPAGHDSQGQPIFEDTASNGREIDNIRAAIDWALSPTGGLSIGLELTAASAPLWYQLSLMTEYRERVERALQRLQTAPAPDDPVEMRLQAALGHALWCTAPEPQAMERAFARALTLAEQIGDTQIQLQALWGAWAVRRGRGEYRAALAVATSYDAIARKVGDQGAILLADRILALTHHDLGNHQVARRHVETVLNQASRSDRVSNTDWQVDARVAMAALLSRIQWFEGFPDQAMITAQEAIDAALRTDHWFSICYALLMAGCPVSLWVGDLAEAQHRIDMLHDRTAGNPGLGRWAQIYATVLRLRQGSERDALIASHMEPRIQISTITTLTALTSAATIPLPLPDDEPWDALWSLSEVLRVDANLLLWRSAPNAEAAAAAKLQRSLDLACQQSALSWELRTALSFARLRIAQGRQDEAWQLLAPVYNKFTEGFTTLDLRSASAMLQSLSSRPNEFTR